MTTDASIVIVGGGLSGLYAAALLEASGIHDYLLLEARPGFGGRIRSEPATYATDMPGADAAQARFDLGATWFWPALQPNLARLIEKLEIPTFGQFESGTMLIERSIGSAPIHSPGYTTSPEAMRIRGGMATLVDTLLGRATPGYRRSGVQVKHIRQLGRTIEVEAIDGAGEVQKWITERVLVAVPPRLAATGITFSPELPGEMMHQWRQTPTWMAAHAKYVAVYDKPFWQENGLSGEARSSVGPMAEIHDASHPGGPAALFGFIGVPASTRARLPAQALRNACRGQMVRLFGPAAALPNAEYLKDWASDQCTAVAADLQSDTGHAHAPSASASAGVWKDRLFGIASEWSPEFPGYVAGAVDAARQGVERVMLGRVEETGAWS